MFIKKEICWLLIRWHCVCMMTSVSTSSDITLYFPKDDDLVYSQPLQHSLVSVYLHSHLLDGSHFLAESLWGTTRSLFCWRIFFFLGACLAAGELVGWCVACTWLFIWSNNHPIFSWRGSCTCGQQITACPEPEFLGTDVEYVEYPSRWLFVSLFDYGS